MPETTRRWLTWIGLGTLGAALGLGLGAVAARGVDWGHVGTELADFPPGLVALAAALVLLSMYLRSLRWWLMWTTERVNPFRLFWVENAALGMNNLSPIRAMDEVLTFGILTMRDRLPCGSVIATMMMSRVQDLSFTLLFISAAVIGIPDLLKFTPAIVATAVFALGWLVLMLNLRRIVRFIPVIRRLPGITAFEEVLTGLWANKRRMAASFALTSAYWILLAPVGLILARGLGIDISFGEAMVIVLGAIFFSTALPGLAGAVGTFEFATVSLLALWGVPKERALSFAFILHLLLFLPPTISAAFVLPREGLRSLGAIRNMVERRKQVHRAGTS